MSELELKKVIESLLFSAGKALSVEELSRLAREADKKKIEIALEELKQAYDSTQSSLRIIKEGEYWKMSVRENFVPVVRRIVTKTELNKSVIETLAVVAAKAPVLQSEIIKIRTNKAYDHLELLEQLGYIKREKKGRTKLITLCQKFFDYFEIPEQKVKQRLASIAELEEKILFRESEVARAQEALKKAEAEKRLKEREEKQRSEEEALAIDAEIASYEAKINSDNESAPAESENPPVEPYVETVNGLEVYDEKEVKEKVAEKKFSRKKKKAEKHVVKKEEELPPELEKVVEEKVEAMTGIKAAEEKASEEPQESDGQGL